jgi:hypothetical protein
VKIHCFGASVTAQRTNHATGEVTGYVPNLKKLLSAKFKDLDILVTSAGSSHFDQAGYCLLPEVLRTNPDILVLDWHTTGLTQFNDQLWQAAMLQIRDAGIRTLIAAFPRRPEFEAGTERPNIRQARELSGGCIKLLDFTKIKGFSPEVHLRDEVHTTPSGAMYYAELLAEEIISLTRTNSAGCPRGFGDNLIPEEPQPDFRVPSVDRFLIADSFIDCFQILIDIQGDVTYENPILVLDHQVGPFSPVAGLLQDGSNGRLRSIWDPWCSWTRQTYTGIPLGASIGNAFKIVIFATGKLPNYKECRDLDFDFNPFNERYLSIRSLFCIGGKIVAASIDPSWSREST